MEVSCFQFRDIHFQPSAFSPIHGPGKRELGRLARFFRPQLRSHHRFGIGCALLVHPNQIFAEYGLPHVRCDCRWSCHSCQSSFDYHALDSYRVRRRGLQRRGKISRDVTVRSELAGTGSIHASREFSENWSNPKTRGIFFYAVTAVAAIILFVPMFLEHPFVLMFDRYLRRAHYFVAKTWAFLTVAPFVNIEYEGLENLPPSNTPAVYVSNHQSFLDIYALLTLGRCFKFISKTSVFLYPIIGWAMFLLGVIPLKRMDNKSQYDCMKHCMALIKKGASVFFFPEGTRSKYGNLGPFKKGAFSIAVKSGVPIVPITLIGTGKIMPPGMEGKLNPGSVKIIVHPSLVGNNADELCSEARNVIGNKLTEER